MASPDSPRRNTHAPLRDRTTDTGERYFITLTTKDREPWLATARTRDVFLAVLRAWHGERNGRVLAASVMPDHVHVLIELSSRQTITQAVNGWRSATRRGAGYAETFQQHHQTHRLKDTEDSEDYALYMLLHPYRGRVCAVGEAWPGWWAPEPAVFKFTASLSGKNLPPQEWVDWPAAKFAGLVVGE
jgi:putative transposase